MKPIKEVIAQLEELGVAPSAIKGALKKKGYKKEEIEKAIPTGEKRVCFVNDYYDWLAEEKRSLAEAEAYIMAPNTSDNVKAYKKMHLNVAELCLAIWEAKEPKVEEPTEPTPPVEGEEPKE